MPAVPASYPALESPDARRLGGCVRMGSEVACSNCSVCSGLEESPGPLDASCRLLRLCLYRPRQRWSPYRPEHPAHPERPRLPEDAARAQTRAAPSVPAQRYWSGNGPSPRARPCLKPSSCSRQRTTPDAWVRVVGSQQPFTEGEQPLGECGDLIGDGDGSSRRRARLRRCRRAGF